MNLVFVGCARRPHNLMGFVIEEAVYAPRRRIVLDTSTATVEQTLTEFLERQEPFLGREDRLRMEASRSR